VAFRLVAAFFLVGTFRFATATVFFFGDACSVLFFPPVFVLVLFRAVFVWEDFSVPACSFRDGCPGVPLCGIAPEVEVSLPVAAESQKRNSGDFSSGPLM